MMKYINKTNAYFPPPDDDHWRFTRHIRDFAFNKVIGRRFWITEDCIDNGQELKPDTCPLALSISDNLMVKDVSVGRIVTKMCFSKDYLGDEIEIPINAFHDSKITEWIDDFDQHSTVEPIEVELIVNSNHLMCLVAVGQESPLSCSYLNECINMLQE